MDRAELKFDAKEQLAGNHFTMIFMIIIIAVICAACNMLLPGIGAIISVVIAAPLGIGHIKAYIKLAKKEEVNVGDIFEHFDLTFRALWMNILVSIFTFLWSLLFFIPGLVKGLAYSAAPYILAINPEVTASEAIAKSMKLMNGHKMELFILQLSFFFWYILVGLTFGIAAFYVIPYVNATMTNFYLNLGVEKIAGEPETVQENA